MSHQPALTRGDRAYRREKIVAAYQRGQCSRSLAAIFGITDSHVRSVVREAGVARRPGRPKQFPPQGDERSAQ